MVKLWKQGVSFTTRTKRNASFDFVDEFVDGDVLVERYVKVVDGVRIWRLKGVSLGDWQTVFDVTTTLENYKLTLLLYKLR